MSTVGVKTKVVRTEILHTHTVSRGPLNDSFPDFRFFPKFPGNAISVFSGIPQGSPSPSAQAAPQGLAISVCSGSPPRDRHLRLLRQPPSRDRHLWPSKSTVRGFGYDYDYGYGYVKSVDSMDNVNSVRCGNGLDNVNSTNSALFLPAAPPRPRIAALLVLLTLSTQLPQRTLLTVSMLSTLLT